VSTILTFVDSLTSFRELGFEDRPLQPHGHHQAHVDDITLRTADDFQQFDFNDPFDMGPSDGIGSQDFHDVDLGINLDDEPIGGETPNGLDDNMSVDESVGVGRDAQHHRDSIHSRLLTQNGRDLDLDLLSNRSKSRGASEHPFGGDVDMDFPELAGMDLGDFGIGFDDMPLDNIENTEKTPGQTRESSRACKCALVWTCDNSHGSVN
jgi:cohesin complex subunit SCC1